MAAKCSFDRRFSNNYEITNVRSCFSMLVSSFRCSPFALILEVVFISCHRCKYFTELIVLKPCIDIQLPSQQFL